MESGSIICAYVGVEPTASKFHATILVAGGVVAVTVPEGVVVLEGVVEGVKEGVPVDEAVPVLVRVGVGVPVGVPVDEVVPVVVRVGVLVSVLGGETVAAAVPV